MGKVVKVVTSGLSSLLPGKVGKIVRGAALVVAGVVTGNPALIMSGVSSIASGLAKGARPSTANKDRLTASIDPDAPRKGVLGATALATDIRYVEFTGSDQEYYHMIVALASHRVQAVDEIWFDDKKAWSSSGGVTSDFSGYLTVAPRLEGTAANTIAISATWGATRRLTGCAYVHLRFKTTGNGKKAESPFSTSIPSRMTVRGKGALTYDPRLDSTNGGAGSQRPDNQATWAWDANRSRNPAIQLLWFLLGWRINGKLVIGCGIPANRIDLQSFITAANICDEPITLTAGGTQPRYRADGNFSEGDDRRTVIGLLCDAMAGTLRDLGGKLSLDVLHNDLAVPVASFGEDNVLAEFAWNQTDSEMPINIVRGRYTDASDISLYQTPDYPAVRIDSLDGLDRTDPFDLPMVENAAQAQRLAKQRLQRAQYSGTFAADFDAAAWKVRLGDVIALTFAPLGFVSKLFRVAEHSVRYDGVCPMVLREENAAIYAWSAEDRAPVVAAQPTTYNPINRPLVSNLAGIDDGATRNVDRGPWSNAGVAYVVGDEVQDQGSTWGCILGHTSTGANGPPALPTTANSWWRIRALAGGSGQAGLNNAPPFIFRRSTSAPALPSAACIYTFATRALAGLNNGWTTTPPAGSDPLYVSAATASASGAADTIAAAEWAAPVIMVQDGTTGATGLNAATIYLYQRNNTGTAPTAPTATLTYTFASGSLSGTLGAWTQSVPAASGGKYLFVTTATALGTGTMDTIASGEWATVNRMAADGADAPPVMSIAVYSLNLAAEYGGAIKTGQLPRTIQATMRNGAADVSSTTSWSVTPSGSISASIAASGLITITAAVGSGWVDVTGTFGGVTETQRISIAVIADAPPPAAATSLSISLPSPANSNSFPATPHNVLTLAASGAGQLKAILALAYDIPIPSSGTRSWTGQAKIVFRAVGGGAWTDFSAGAVNGSPAFSFGGTTSEAESGFLSLNQTQTGLSAGALYEVGWMLRRLNAGDWSGSVSTSGNMTVRQP